MSYSRASEYTEPEQEIATLAKTIVHPARLRILQQLSNKTLTLRQLTEDQPLPRPNIMRHLNVLIFSGLVTIESPYTPATYSTSKEHWPPFISYAVRLSHRFNHQMAA